MSTQQVSPGISLDVVKCLQELCAACRQCWYVELCTVLTDGHTYSQEDLCMVQEV